MDIGSVTIESDPKANDGKPIDVDLVFVYDQAAAQKIGAESASDWFKTRSQRLASLGDAVHVMSWQATPGVEVPETEVDEPASAKGAFVFADYAGSSAVPVNGSGGLTITLAPSGPSVDIEQ